ncbi:rifin PIR protein, putative [Plasmodium sp. gorilla clade G2]|uniref:rifin PIR protein, putative n=1 Tax=Plasmodium sp. gorilla clade G2 TaxID=880535 RepID=UPI000D29D822|nr:rifin PIR protein, putative [Plasmodium sp. gorilla clade G2]SOV20327.1 rifin PIR protein, putative [Plasmodium sp. gorilla clade G2]
MVRTHVRKEKKHMDEFEKLCNDGKDVEKDKNCSKGSEHCKQQCNRYNRWITTHKNEWLGQKSKYEVILNDKFDENYDDFKQHINGNADANTYITSKNDKCKNSGGNHINVDDFSQMQIGIYSVVISACNAENVSDNCFSILSFEIYFSISLSLCCLRFCGCLIMYSLYCLNSFITFLSRGHVHN